MTNRPKQLNERSILLQDHENEAIFSLLDRNCVSLSTAVVQLYLASPPNLQKWNKRHCGVVCFVKDNPKRSYYIRMYDPKSKQMLWEQELYNQFKYKAPRDYFHTFEADDCQAGLNFASETEASKFKQMIEGKLYERAKKRMEKKKQQGGTKNVTSPPNQPKKNMNVGSGAPLTNTNVPLNKPAPVKESNSKKKSGKDKKKKLTKEDISTPTDFRHVSHVGWDPNTGLDMKKLDPDMKELFEQVGIHDQSQVDEETLDFIYDFVENHGGINAVRQEMAKRPPPPAPQHQGAPPPPPPTARVPQTQLPRQAPPPPARAPGVAPPPPPHRPHGGAPPPPPPGRQGLPPPPPPNRIQGGPPPPPPADMKQGGGVPPPPPPVPAFAPPPAAPAPPPPPPGGGFAPPPPPVPANGGGGPGRNDLLSAIHKGANLKKVEAGSGVGGGNTDARGGLLNAIRGGATLKPVQQQQSNNSSSDAGIVGALAQALAMRKNVIQGSDDDDDTSDDVDEDDDDEWDD